MVRLYGGEYTTRNDIVLKDGAIPLTYWVVETNFGDLLSPWLVEKLTGLPVRLVKIKPGHDRKKPGFLSREIEEFSHFAIGSIASRTNSKSIVWGSGTFGTEIVADLKNAANYLAVRGPLTRNIVRIHGGACPEVYGDPALLLPEVYSPKIEKKHKVGLILRWSEADWHKLEIDPEVKMINFGTDKIEETLDDILSCERIISSSLHGLVLADAYGIPSAWLVSDSPKGFEFKYYDYFLSVNKIQKPQKLDFSSGRITLKGLMDSVRFYDAAIEFDGEKLLAACPFLEKAGL